MFPFRTPTAYITLPCATALACDELASSKVIKPNVRKSKIDLIIHPSGWYQLFERMAYYLPPVDDEPHVVSSAINPYKQSVRQPGVIYRNFSSSLMGCRLHGLRAQS